MNVAGMLTEKGSSVATISPDRPVIEAVELLKKWHIGALVVSEDGRKISGMLSERDIVEHLADEGTIAMQEPVHALMSTEVLTCNPSDRSEGIMARMTSRRVRHLPVVDHDGLLCGIISIGDVVKSRVEDLEREQAQLIDYVQGGR